MRSFIQTLLVCLVLLPGARLYAASHAVVLQYHHFGSETPPSTSLSVDLFKQHLAYLAEHEYQVWPLERILQQLRSGAQVPDKTVAITIDDAYISVYTRAFPLLKSYGYPFTVFVATEPVEQGLNGFMTWAQMEEMQSQGASFENHSHTHAYLIRRLSGESKTAWQERVSQEIRQAGEIIKRKLGREPRLFAYPFGEYNSALMEVVSDLKLTGIGQHSGPIWAGNLSDPLPRYPMAADFALMDSFITKIATLPLPVVKAEPRNPELAQDETKPMLRLTLQAGEYRTEAINCFASGQGRIEVRRSDGDEPTLEVRAIKDLPPGRSRYNCTAPAPGQGRFYWYSHPWIRP